MIEASHINYSLLVLGKCISSLVLNKSYIPYRESELTMLLKSCFGGNSKTSIIINASCDDSNGDETLQALKFGENCSMITNITKIASNNYDSAISMIDETIEKIRYGMINLENQNRTNLPS